MIIYPDVMASITTPLDPEDDDYKRKSIMKGNLIIFYLSTIPKDLQQELSDLYFNDFGRTFTEDMQSLLSKDFHDLVSAITMPTVIYQCTMLNYYLKGPGTDKKLLLEILCTISKPEVAEIVGTYKSMYDCTLAEHMSSETSDDFRRLLTHIVTGARREDPVMDSDRAWETVQLLDHEGPAMWGMDHGRFVQILANESFAMIRLIFTMYKNIGGRTIEEVIRNEIYGELKNAMTAIVSCIMNPAAWLARKLHGVMNGSDDDDAAIVRIIVGRAKRDLLAVNTAYDILYDKTLLTAILDFSQWRDTCRCLGYASFRRFVSSFYKPRNVTARKIAKKILYFTLVLDDVY